MSKRHEEEIYSFALVPLTQCQVAVVDAEDYEYLSQWKWRAKYEARTHTWYAVRDVPRRLAEKRTIMPMHRQILNPPDGLEVDHRDGDGLNNQRSNLRPCTKSQNQFNSWLSRRNTSGHKGVCWHKASHKWRVQVNANGKEFYLGLFTDKTAAIQVYRNAATKLHGEFARMEPTKRSTQQFD